MTLTKANIIRAASVQTGFTQNQSRHSVNCLIEIIKKTLESGESIKIGHFGKFDIKEKKARAWRSPFTGRIMMLPERRIVKFKAFKRLKDKIDAPPVGTGSEELSRPKFHAVRTGVLTQNELSKILADHRRWLDSGGKSGHKAVMPRAALFKADLYAARLSRIDLQGADLREALLSEADLYEADLRRANLADAVLDWACLDYAKLQRASLKGADLRWANLEGANMSGCDLRFANLDGANLKDAKLTEANLYGMSMKNTDMQGAILTKIKLDYETQLNLPKTVFDEYRQTFRMLEWSPALSPSY
ncbi:MAG: pentapeptide repeat-containing protein [Desulfobacterales bacterium]|jgi:nucleoid DNA-binding protein